MHLLLDIQVEQANLLYIQVEQPVLSGRILLIQALDKFLELLIQVELPLIPIMELLLTESSGDQPWNLLAFLNEEKVYL